MRLAVLACVVSGCSFSPLPFDPGVDPEIDAPPNIDAPDGAIVRAIEVVDGKVEGGPHQDFPLLISLADAELRALDSGGKVATATGFDIGFFGDSGLSQRLAHEVERYDNSTGEIVAWVKVPMLSDATTIFLTYGDPAITTSQEDVPAVWSAGYVGVWHLADATSATDVIGPGNDVGTGPTEGQIEGGRTFNGGNTVIAAPTAAALDNLFAGGGTVEGWMFASGAGGELFGRLFDKLDVVGLGMCDGNMNQARSMLFTAAFTGTDGIWCTAQDSVVLDTWMHVALVYDSTNVANEPLIYLDGTPRALTVDLQPTGNALSDVGGAFRIGNRFDVIRGWNGRIDEMRAAPVIRDAGWIGTSHENQLAPLAFTSLAAVQ